MVKINRSNNVYQIAFFPRFFPVNCYLIEEEKELTLIDAGLPLSTKGILEAAGSIGKPISKIVLTHVHDDHVGALDALKERMPDVPVYVSKRDAKLMNGDLSLEEGEPAYPIRGGVPKKLNTRADILLKEGDRIGSLLAIETPGHTPGSMAFIDTRTNAMIVGDAFQTKGGIAVSGQLRPLFPFPALATWNKELALKSAKKIHEYNPSLLAVGHGSMIEQPLNLIKSAITEAERKLV